MKKSLKSTVSVALALVLTMSVAFISQTEFKTVSSDNGLSGSTLQNAQDQNANAEKSYSEDIVEYDTPNLQPEVQNVSLKEVVEDTNKLETQATEKAKAETDKKSLSVVSKATAESNTTQEPTQTATESTDETFRYSDRYKDYATGVKLSDEAIPEDVEVIDSAEDYYRVVTGNRKTVRANSSLPKSVDNSTSKYFPTIGNQGSLGSCTCWSIVHYQFTYEFNKKNGIDTTPETTYSPLFTYNLVNWGEDTGSNAETVYDTLSRYGSPLNIEFPYCTDYKKWPTNESIWRSALNRKVEGYQVFERVGTDDSKLVTSADDKDLEAIKTSLKNGDILSYSTYIRSWIGTKLKSIDGSNVNSGYVGQEAVIKSDGSDGGHQMVIVGYNDDIWVDINSNGSIDDGEMGAFKIVNSWGEGYANGGFTWIAYDALNYKSCVNGVVDNKKRVPIFDDVYRVDVGLYGDTSGIILKATLSSGNRYDGWMSILTNKDGTEEGISVLPLGKTVLAYDGTTTACDMDIVVDMKYFINDVNSDNLKDFNIQFKFEDKNNRGTPFIIKKAEICDENRGITYGDNSVYPISLKNSSRTVDVIKSTANHAVVYYRGYKNPNIKYKLSGGSWNCEKGEPMLYNIEKYGYVNKYVIDLKNTSEAYVCINDGNGTWDDNNGKYYVVKKGYNYIVTENVGEPIDFTYDVNVKNVASVNTYFNANISATGGYAPYMCRIEVQDINRDKIFYETEYNIGSFLNITLKEEGIFKIKLYVKDCAGTEVVKSQYLEVVDIPIEIEKLEILSGNNINVGDTVDFRALTKNDSYYPGRFLNVSIVKDGVEFYNSNLGTSKYNISARWADYRFSWVPESAGKYYLTVQRQDNDNDYVSKTIPFTVNPIELKSEIYLNKTEDIVMGDTLRISASAKGSTGKCQYMYSYSRYGEETVIADYSGVSSILFSGFYEAGPYQLIVRVKDPSGVMTTATRDIWINQSYIRRLYADTNEIQAGNKVKISADTVNISSDVADDKRVFVIEKDGSESKVIATNDSFEWTPSEKGDYTITYNIYDKSGANLLTSFSKNFTVAENLNFNKVTVAVISYIVNEGKEADFRVHYWGGDVQVGDATCTKLGSTVQKSVGSGYWNGTKQTFCLYEAYIPKNATGYKFRIGDRWFGTDGSISTSNTVYVFNYSGDKCLYE